MQETTVTHLPQIPLTGEQYKRWRTYSTLESITTSPEYCQSQIDFFKKQLITKEEYLTKSTELRKRKLEIETELRELEENYIHSNLEYLMGDKLEIFRDGVTTGTFGFVRDMSTHNGDIIPRLYKCKKDGTPSKHEYYLWGRGLTFIRVK